MGIQVTFWFFANLLLGIIIHFYSLVNHELYPSTPILKFSTILILAFAFGILQGTVLGISDYYLGKKLLQYRTLGKIILAKFFISFIVVFLLTSIGVYIISASVLKMLSGTLLIKQSRHLWYLLFSCLAIYYFLMTLLVSYINQMRRKFGPGVLIPLLLGKYSRPQDELRILLFMDLNGSTTLAEKLGHIRYSEFIRDSFLDINLVVPRFSAQIYQYVGDEIVLTWPYQDSDKYKLAPLDFFFECQRRFQRRSAYYLKHYGQVPSFKAGVHMGEVTAVEIGDIKRDIAYHGDTMNTAARILGVCNEYHKDILVSDTMLQSIRNLVRYKIEQLGMIRLRGKMEEVAIASVQPVK